MNLFNVKKKKKKKLSAGRGEERAQSSGLDPLHVVYLGCDKRRTGRKSCR